MAAAIPEWTSPPMPSKHQGLPLRVGHPTFVRFVAKLADLRVLRLRAQLECQAERAIRSHNQTLN